MFKLLYLFVDVKIIFKKGTIDFFWLSMPRLGSNCGVLWFGVPLEIPMEKCMEKTKNLIVWIPIEFHSDNREELHNSNPSVNEYGWIHPIIISNRLSIFINHWMNNQMVTEHTVFVVTFITFFKFFCLWKHDFLFNEQTIKHISKIDLFPDICRKFRWKNKNKKQVSLTLNRDSE